MNLSNFLLPTYSNMLKALSLWLKKAEAQFEDADAFLSERLAPDMLPLTAQVRYACAQVYEAVASLRGDEVSLKFKELLNEGSLGKEKPGTIAEAQARIDETLAYLIELDSDAIDSGFEQQVSLHLPNGAILDMDGAHYVRDWAIPQIYFHVTTAYAILRHMNVNLGKADYALHALAYVRKSET